jgi:hypothetical protein
MTPTAVPARPICPFSAHEPAPPAGLRPIRLSSLDRSALALAMTRLATCPDTRFPAGYAALIAGVEWLLREEEETLERLGLATWRQRAQHRRVLAVLYRSERRVLRGDVDGARATLRLLDHWFTQRQRPVLAQRCAGGACRGRSR